MAVPLTQADIMRLRTTQHKTKLALAVYHPGVMMTAVSTATNARGAISLAVGSVILNQTPFMHAQVLFGTIPGSSDVGTARFKSYSAGVLTVGANQVAVASGNYVTVVKEIKPASILPFIQSSGTVLEDGLIAYVDQSSLFHPLALMGPPAVGLLSGGRATVNFYSNSKAVAQGATISSALWTFPYGDPATSTTPGTATVPVSVVWTQEGQFYVSLQVTDSNGKTHTTYRPVFIIDPNNASSFYDQIELDNFEGDIESGGWTCKVNVLSTADPTNFPNQALAVVFALDEWYGDENISIGGDYSFRENVVFVGYVRNDSVQSDWKGDRVSFDVDGIGRLLDNILAWPANLKAGSGAWHSLLNMNCDLAAFHVLTEHSTVPEICDVDLSTLPQYSLKFMDLSESTLKDQLGQQLYTAVRSRIGSSRTGILYARPNPQLLPSASRTQAVLYDLNLDDLRETIDLGPEPHEKQVSQVDFIGFRYTGPDPDPVYSLAPGSQWPTGRVQRVDGVRADSQDEANALSGLFEGYLNAAFKQVSFPLRGNYRVFDILPHYKVTFSLTADKNPRGLSWASQVFWPNRVLFRYKSGILLTTLTAEIDVVGAPGVAGNYPTTPVSPPGPNPHSIPPPPPLPLPGISPFPGGPHSGDWRPNVYIATSGKGVFYSSNFTGPGGAMPTWTAVNTGLPTIAILDFKPDPFRPSVRQYCLVNDGAADSQPAIYRRVNQGSWTQILNQATMKSLRGVPSDWHFIMGFIQTDVNTDGYIAAVAMLFTNINSPEGAYYWYSKDYGATWNFVNMSAPAMVNPTFRHLDIGYFRNGSPYTAGQVLYVPMYAAGVFSTNAFMRSFDKGQSWNQPSPDPNIDWEFTAFQTDAYQDVCYAYESANGLRRSLDRGSNFSLLLAEFALPYFYSLHALFPGDQSKATTLRLVTSQNLDGTGIKYLRKSTDAGVSWPEKNALAMGGGTNQGGFGLSVVHDAPNKLYFVALRSDSVSSGPPPGHHVYVSADEGNTVEGKAGSDRSSGSTTGIPFDSGSVVHILQAWDQ